jgi:hypothetical protein
MGEFIVRSVVIGIGATAVLDLWALMPNRLIGLGLPNWAMVGRWVAHLPSGRLMHDDIALAAPVRNELALGWAFHYAVGIVFAAAVLIIGGPHWGHAPTLWPAMLVGWVTVGAGWFILSPGLGGGIAASKRPNPNRIRLFNLIGHTVFGLGLFGTALLIA